MIGLTNSVAETPAPHNVRVNPNAPGLTNTEILSGISHDRIDTIVESTPLARIGQGHRPNAGRLRRAGDAAVTIVRRGPARSRSVLLRMLLRNAAIREGNQYDGTNTQPMSSTKFCLNSMIVFVKTMLIGKESEPPERIDTTLQQFFVDDVMKYQNPDRFPLDKDRWCRDGGCQFAFDRNESAPLRCINCDAPACTCLPSDDPAKQKRYALQRFTTTRVYLLDIDLNDTRIRGYGRFSRYHALTYSEEQQLRKMEERLMEAESMLFFYRTKCNGYRVAFETAEQICNMEQYETLCMDAERRIEPLTPDGRFSDDGWFKVDRISRGDRNYRSHAYWGYPRVHNPIWLNPNRVIH
jgi:hypothetical protein